MPAPLLLDLSHTSHTLARTGIQRVVRSLHAALGERAVAITHDPHARRWRLLAAWERATLAAESAAPKRGARWPLAAQLRGRAHRWLDASASVAPELAGIARKSSGLLAPEVFSPDVARALPALMAVTAGPRAALFHDAIALKLPELTPAKTVARFPAYLAELLVFDGIAAVSDDSRDSLLDYWRWLGARNPPPVQTIALGSNRVSVPLENENPPSRAEPVILSVGSIEGRKNHLALLEACEQLWARGETFSLHLLGLAQPQTGAAALACIRRLQAARRPLRYDGPVSDAALEAAYAGCAFTVYPSLREGFGLPVIESLARGKPCICSARGALGEAARGGGCVMLDRVDAASLAAAIAELLQAPTKLASLRTAARERHFKTWAEYATELTGWLGTLPRRS